MVDNRALAVQCAETADRIRVGIKTLHQSGDRIAILLASSLGAMQSRRFLTGFAPKLFDIDAEALEWLRGGFEADPTARLDARLVGHRCSF